MKKTFLTFILSFAMLLSCFVFGACNSVDYQGKQFILEDISATYDDTVSEAAKTEQESKIQDIKNQISSENPSFCRFYATMNTLLTNCNGEYRFAKYTVNGGKVQIDTSTTIDSAKKDKLPTRIKSLGDSSLDNAVFSTENNKLVLIETSNGITLKYIFAENGAIDESTENLTNSSFTFVEVAYTHYPTDEAKDAAEQAFAKNARNTNNNGSLDFYLSDENILHCTITQGLNFKSYECRKNGNNSNVIYYGNGSNNYFWVYGDLLFFQIQNYETYNLGYLFYIKDRK